MKWYYVYSGRQAGPVEENQLAELLDSGKIQPDVLVWHEGMSDWQPYHQAIPKAPAAKSSVLAASPISSPTRAQSAVTNREGTAEAVCSECGRMFNIERTTKIGESRVCADCKPLLLQGRCPAVQESIAGEPNRNAPHGQNSPLSHEVDLGVIPFRLVIILQVLEIVLPLG